MIFAPKLVSRCCARGGLWRKFMMLRKGHCSWEVSHWAVYWSSRTATISWQLVPAYIKWQETSVYCDETHTVWASEFPSAAGQKVLGFSEDLTCFPLWAWTSNYPLQDYLLFSGEEAARYTDEALCPPGPRGQEQIILHTCRQQTSEVLCLG